MKHTLQHSPTIVAADAPVEDRVAVLAVRWFDASAAHMPWRANRHPWPVLVSEIMLQQTRVDTVRGYFAPFLQRFPDPQTLAQASEQALLDAWRGLGYYRRARSLQSAAKVITEDFEGCLPDSVDLLQTLPGVGPYTARAVAAIAFGQPCLPVDGNVARVLARLGARRQAVRKLSAAADRRWTAALRTVDAGSAIQALMEIGSTICLPAAPRCETCPFVPLCKAGGRKNPAHYGQGAKRQEAKSERWRAYALFDPANRLLLLRRPSGLLGDQWALPMQAGDEARLPTPRSTAIGTSTHVFTHRKWHTQLQLCDPYNKPDPPASLTDSGQLWHWCSDPDRCVTSRAFAKMLSQIDQHHALPKTLCKTAL